MNIVIVALCLLAVMVLFIVKRIKKEQRSKKRKSALAIAYNRLVLQHKLSIEYHEQIGSSIIAIDHRNKKLLVIAHNEGSKQEACVSLPSVSFVAIDKEKNTEGGIQKVVLQLKQKSNDALIQFCFFDAGIDAEKHLPARIRKALYWEYRLDAYSVKQNKPTSMRLIENMEET